MSFYLWVSLAAFALVAYDLITGKITWGSWILFMRAGATRRDDPKHFWIAVMENGDRRRIGRVGVFSRSRCWAEVRSRALSCH
jgi:hypothetical protein